MQNQHSNVVILKDEKVVFKNNMFEEFVKDIFQNFVPDRPLNEAEDDRSQAFCNLKIFRPAFIASFELYSLLEVSQQLISGPLIFAVKFGDSVKRIFEINKQKFDFNNEETDLFTISEQTASYQLQKANEQNIGIKFANSFISN